MNLIQPSDIMEKDKLILETMSEQLKLSIYEKYSILVDNKMNLLDDQNKIIPITVFQEFFPPSLRMNHTFYEKTETSENSIFIALQFKYAYGSQDSPSNLRLRFASLNQLYISPKHQGIGSFIVNEIIKLVSAIPSLETLYLSPYNDTAHDFFKKMKFEYNQVETKRIRLFLDIDDDCLFYKLC